MSVKHKCEDLPEGWVVKMSRSRGVQYYFDTHTGQSSWKKPTASSIKVSNEMAKRKCQTEKSSCDQSAKDKNSSFLNKMKGEIKKHRETYSKISQIRKKAQDVQQKEMEKAMQKVAKWKKSIQNSCGKAPAEAKLIANVRKNSMNDVDVIKISQKQEEKSKSGGEKKQFPKGTTYERTEVKKEVAEKTVPEQSNINTETGKRGKKMKKKKKLCETTISQKIHSIANKEKMKASTQPAKKSQTIATVNKLNTQAVRERLSNSLPCLDVRHNQLKNINKKLAKGQPSEAVVSSTISDATEGSKSIIATPTTYSMATSDSANSGMTSVSNEVDDNAEDDCMMEGIEVTDPTDVYQIIDDIHMEFQEKFRPVYVVLDTNVLIYDWKFLKQKTNADSSECAYVCFIVPWVVIQELDSLKQAKRSPSLTTNVTNAIKYVNQAIREKHRMIGQSIQDTTLIQEFDMKNNDDKILQCCLQYQQRIKNGRLALCTNDINLQTKAMVSGINAFSQKDFMKEIEKLQGSGSVLPGDMQIQSVHCYNDTALPLSTDPGTASNSQVLSLLEIEEEMFCVLKSALSVALETEMKDVYDEHWKDIVIVKPPWSFKDVMVCYDKHWIAVFGMFLPRNFKTVVESLLSYAKKKNTPKVENPERLKLIISQAIGLCQSHVPHFKARIPELQTAIKLLFSLHNQCSNLLNTLTYTTEDTREKAENNIPEEKQVDRVTSTVSEDQTSIHIAQVFETVWQVITQISVLVFDSVGFTHTIECKGIEHMARPSVQQAVQWLYSSGRMLQDIIKAFHRVLETNTPSLHDASTLLETLNHLLVESKATLDVAIDVQDFLVFCSLENNRKVLAGGLVQLQDILTMLEQCALTCCNINT
ncbi:transcriptional protein SWT1-like [Anneissia japonica]|uniref:transcriptional protein SWT1-like n=1 Tax=Anneissia japonica TaxID=1529436 RepID=UPI0014258BA2|nr:transcriptional protein SWT1-like [Anneissia japonica]XP_033095452.1 transcriptional protein SWT1-like [Anneissia japonica]XP_033095453.1 transcriptional protein SWT1-like [Anneissia japonica]